MIRNKIISKIMILALTVNLLPASSINAFAEEIQKEKGVTEIATNESIYGPYDGTEEK